MRDHACMAFAGRWPCFYIAALSAAILFVFAGASLRAAASDPGKTMGANACAECHKQEAEAWKASHHFQTFHDMPRNRQASEIAKRMGVRRVKQDGLCRNCHFTVQRKDGVEETVSGISCESCHGAGQDWIKVHSGYSGKKAETESKSEAAVRWKLAEQKGMLRPSALYDIAKNCLSCHVVPHEDLVNKGGHKAGSAFELLTWSQGEVRHNSWHSKGKSNVEASAERKRMLYLVGLGTELETSLRAAAKATTRKPYAFIMAQRADKARRELAVAAKAAANIPEIAKVVELSHSANLKLNNEQALTAAAEAIAVQLKTIAGKYDGSTLGGLDRLLPGSDRYKGTARAAAGVK